MASPSLRVHPRKMPVQDARTGLQRAGRCAVSSEHRAAHHPVIGVDMIPDVYEVPFTAVWENLQKP